ncbi:SusC/RagA family TonB-linked outer membrane protein [Sediminibacterium soli]|uniref:SusC/RagA family TonB-linked outer membrane protein n=1 Tax=Sediminibacterium soli TaxID=2698829 RepID=UPI00137AF188|nr:TonB-dependent receptor [Sediminibacterium soli]NCI47119.1 TonB-dependent receptor [Sediminibacterium soli]
MPKTYSLLARNALLVLAFSVFALTSFAQKRVSGKITNKANGQPIAGATVQVKGTTATTITNSEGTFTINASEKSSLVVTVVGFQSMERLVGSNTSLDFALTEVATALDEIVVTGYTAQKKKDIIGAVSVVSTKDLQATPASNMAVQLQGRAAGVVVSSAGEPGAGAVVRIRGFASAGNNDPLYVIDGVPTTDGSKLNPNDIESLQVLKDASAASIYGSRASNGVIIVTTKQGKAGRPSFTYDAYIGSQVVTDGMMPKMLNTSQYMDYLQRTTGSTYTHPVFGANGSFKIPDYYITSAAFKGGVAASDPRANPALYSISPLYQISKTSSGTNWFDELTRNALIMSHQISASGGTDKAQYSLGANYFNQEGSFLYTYFKRYSVRANTSFKPVSFLKIGENLQISYEERLGGSNRGEGDAWASAFRMVPYIPVYDIKGGFGGNGVGESGNGSNPIANLTRARDNTNKFTRLFGNIYAEVPFTSWLSARSSFGVDMGTQFTRSITRKTYERSENQATTQLTEDGWYYANWTWTNTLTFEKTFKDHNVKVLAGTEAIKNYSRGVRAFGQNFDFETPDFVSLNTATAGSLSDRTISNYNVGRSTLFSYFGRLDYIYKNRYLLTATFRRDGSSVFGPNVRYANFPSIGLAWRVSEENFMKSVSWITDLKLRGGWGQMGSTSNVDPNNQFFTYISNPERTNYDINGNNTSSAQGYRNDREGNLNTKWETLESTNFGVDATLFNGKVDFTLDIYKKDTKDLLVDAVRNGLEPQLTKPRVNIGTMRNTGFDLAINYHGGTRGDFSYDLGVTFSHYKNVMTKLNNEGSPRVIGLERLASAIRTDVGQPISSFHGFILDGFYNSAADLAALSMPGAVIGSWRYKDLNGDKKITDADRTYLGNPHPDFQMGLNVGLNYKAWNLTAFFFWNQGNEIFNYTKYYTDMRVFVGGVSTRVLTDSWTAGNPNAKLPLLAPGAANGYTSYTTTTSNSYYVEDGSYLRAKTMQLSYTLPKSIVNKVKLQGVKLYVQAQNLFTITKYKGADPDMNLLSRDPFGARDYYLGVDLGGFPNPKQYLFGLNVTF